MADGGFSVKFDGKDQKPCYAFSVDYDAWTYKTNEDDPKPLPLGLKAITITVDKTSR